MSRDLEIHMSMMEQRDVFNVFNRRLAVLVDACYVLPADGNCAEGKESFRVSLQVGANRLDMSIAVARC